MENCGVQNGKIIPSNGKEKTVNEKTGGWFDFKAEVVWTNVAYFAIWHLITFYYMFTFPYSKYKGLMVWAWALAEINMIGITAGLHRLWSHRAYKARSPLRLMLAIFITASGGDGISHWVRDHRVHHKWTDTDADPYSSARGFFFSHMGWQLMKKHPDTIERGRSIDMSDVTSDPIVSFFDRHFRILKILLAFILPVLIPVYLFNQDFKAALITQWFFRYPFYLHSAFCVNSFAHMWGYRSYDRTISSAENAFVSMLTCGEGWHNYHHAFPWDYKVAELGSFFFNRTTGWIRLWSKLGLAYDLKELKPEHIKKLVMRKGDGSHPVWDTQEDSQGAEEFEKSQY